MKVQVVKVGGQVAADPAALGALLSGFAALDGPKVLVHGGGKEATALAARLDIPTRMVDGRRITDPQMLDVVTMVYGGLVNKRLVCGLQALGVDAVGLSGADGGLIRSHRRPPVDGVDYGEVGDVDAVNTSFLLSLLERGLTPVICPLTWDGASSLLNTNADTIAQSVATALAAGAEVTLTYCFDLEGVLDADGKTVPCIDAGSFAALKASGALQGGILPKIANALEAVRQGVKAVRICRYDLKTPGTLIQ